MDETIEQENKRLGREWRIMLILLVISILINLFSLLRYFATRMN
jgi:hypothetical protein